MRRKGILGMRGFLVGGAIVVGASFLYMGGTLFPVTYDPNTPVVVGKEKTVVVPIPTKHLPTPEPLKALYMTSWAAGTPSLRDHVIRLADETEVNAIVIDIKDYSGTIAFPVGSDIVMKEGFIEERIPDVRNFITTLHEKDIYVIGRITVFQDPLYAKRYPERAVQKESDKSVWKDYKGLSFVDVSAREYWDYIVALSEDAYALGFDELNFDYIRFPSDGNMKDIYYPVSGNMLIADSENGKATALERFFKYLSEQLRDTDVVLSADLFGMTTTNTDDLNIGQVLERASPYFDYIAPMVYPSHYPKTFIGLSDPNKYPYEVVKYSLDKAVARMTAASTTPAKIRPWLQDFDYGGNYGEKEVRAQIQATYDAGLTSWMLWDPANRYTPEALNEK